MARDARPVFFSNFVCHFGNLELLDLCQEVVLPAFLSSYTRQYADTRYFLYGAELTTVSTASGTKEPAIVGKFVKDTVYHRAQVFENGKLVQKPYDIATAPSALFVLLLSNHKLIYVTEVSGAPTQETFGTTIVSFMKKSRSELLKRLTKEAIEKNPDGKPLAVLKKEIQKELQERFPVPDLEIVPLASDDGIQNFIDKFQKLNIYSIRLIKPNNEINNDGFFDKLQKNSESLNSRKTSLVYRNSEGLSKEVVLSTALQALDGNATISISGEDKNGQKISGDNEHFKVQQMVKDIPVLLRSAAQKLFMLYRESIETGTLKVSNPSITDEKQSLLKCLCENEAVDRNKQ